MKKVGFMYRKDVVKFGVMVGKLIIPLPRNAYNFDEVGSSVAVSATYTPRYAKLIINRVSKTIKHRKEKARKNKTINGVIVAIDKEGNVTTYTPATYYVTAWVFNEKKTFLASKDDNIGESELLQALALFGCEDAKHVDHLVWNQDQDGDYRAYVVPRPRTKGAEL